MNPTLPCLKCGEKLNNIFADADTGNQPRGGLEFVAYGHYGSASFDPMDGSKLILNLCDKCVRLCMGDLSIKKLRPRQER